VSIHELVEPVTVEVRCDSQEEDKEVLTTPRVSAQYEVLVYGSDHNSVSESLHAFPDC